MWESEIQQIVDQATEANHLIEMLTEQLSQYTMQHPTERAVLAVALLKASIDMGAAATRLLMLDPIQYGGAAEAMFRPQLERYLRAVYFGSPKLSTEQQLKAFVEDDKIGIKFEDLARKAGEEVVAQFGRDVTVGQRFAEVILLEKTDLHGAVHGGKMVALRYMNDHVAYDLTPLSDAPFIHSMMLLSLLAYSQAVHTLGSPVMIATPEFAALLATISPAFKAEVDAGMPMEDSADTRDKGQGVKRGHKG